MRKSNIVIVIAAFAVVALALWMWPSSKSSPSSQEKVTESAAPATLEQRRQARRTGAVSTAQSGLSGTVLEEGTNQPIVGALISLSPRSISGGMISKAGQSPTPLMTRTDASGKFRLSTLDAGSYSLSASATGFRPQAQDNIALAAGVERDDIHFVLAAGGHLLRGTVSDIGGGPVAFAQVRAMRISEFRIGTLFTAPFTATTNDNGAYALNLEDGTYQVSVFHEDYRKADEQVIISGTDRTADFTLTPGSLIEGIVLRSSDDSPVENALVTVAPAGRGGGFVISGIAFGGGAQTDAKGRFRLGSLGSGAFELRAVARNASARQPTQVELGIAETLSDVVVYVDDAYTISGFVVDRDDESVPEAGVLVGAYNFSPGAVFASSTPSASDGYFEIHGVHPGIYTMGAAAEERQPTFFGESVTIVDENISDLIVEVKKGATLRGRVSPPQVAQLHLGVNIESAGFSTMLQAAGSFLVNATSNAEGEFELLGVSPGDYTIEARAESGDTGSLEVSVSGDAEGLEIAMQERASADGIVVDASGAPVEGVQVSFSLDGADNIRGFGMQRPLPKTMTGPDGQFVHRGLEDGEYTVTVHDGAQIAWAGREGDAAYEPESIEVLGGSDVRGMRLAVVSRNGVLRGSVVDSTGAIVPDAWVTATYIPDAHSSTSGRWGQEEAPVLSDDSGRFEIIGLRSGLYGLEAESTQGGARGEIEEVRTGSDVTIELAALGIVVGTVRMSGAPVGDYVVTISGPTRRRAHIVRDDGVFRFGRLEPGKYSVEVASAAGAASASVEVKSGEESKTSLTLADFGSITGTLVDQGTGEPLVGIAVAATVGESNDQWAKNAMDMLQGNGPTTDEEGRFRIGNLPAGSGAVYFIDPKLQGFGMLATQNFDLEPSEAKDLGEIEGSRDPKGEGEEEEPKEASKKEPEKGP